MASVLVLLFELLFVGQMIGTVVYLILIRRLMVRLSEGHRDTWRELGEPSLFLNNTPRNNMLLLRWLWRRSYLALDAPDDIRLAARVRSLLLTLLLTFLILIGSFLGAIVSADQFRLATGSERSYTVGMVV
jgi:hypothetical protein